MTVCSLNLEISPSSKNRAPIHHESANFFRKVCLLSFPLVMGIAMCEKVLKVFASGQSNVRSGTSMTTRWVLIANMKSGNPGNQNASKNMNLPTLR